MGVAKAPSTGWSFSDDEGGIEWTGEESTQSLNLYYDGSEMLLGADNPGELPLDTYLSAYDKMRRAWDLVPAPMYAYHASIAADLAGDLMTEDKLGGADQMYAAKEEMACAAAHSEVEPGGIRIPDFWGTGVRTVESMNKLGPGWGAIGQAQRENVLRFCNYGPTVGTVFGSPDASVSGLLSGDALKLDPALTSSPSFIDSSRLRAKSTEVVETKPPARTSRAIAWGAVAILGLVGVSLVGSQFVKKG
jgi:hypothetical protein